jgi:hypothetical protein
VAPAGGNRAKQPPPRKASRNQRHVSVKSDDARGDNLSKEFALIVIDVDHVLSSHRQGENAE